MFVGFSKKVRGGLRLGAGMRITKKNFLYMAFIVLMYYIAYISVVGSIWLIVVIFYGIFVLPVKWIIRTVKGDKQPPPITPPAEVSPAPTTQTKPQFTMQGCGGTFINGKKQAVADVVLSSDEQAAVDIILNELEQGGVDVESVHVERTQEYLKVVGYKHFTFCQLALKGTSKLFSLTVQGKDQKALFEDSRFANIDIKKGRYFRIPIDYVDDIRSYSDLICPAFEWATTNAADYAQ